MDLLPHRFPFLLVDKVLELVPNESVVVQKNVTASEPCFQGHFPDYPLYPGVLLLESMAQTMAFVTFGDANFERKPDSVYFLAGIDKARFKRQVVPGDVVIIKTRLLKTMKGAAKFESEAYVGDELACSATIMGMLKEVER
ncbi:(3R)-hydroxymyristoyl-(acyl carrier protein) dehydratase [gamma proteobacterium HTCC5015]|nr:(3R)-hydroxymyristoyl-(acyl carrier protein) dehydratase [gamma proteobacterium HTCC5015]